MRRRAPHGAALSPREREVLGWLARGLYRKEIARRQGVTQETVKTQLRGIYAKLGVTSRSEAAALVWDGERFRLYA